MCTKDYIKFATMFNKHSKVTAKEQIKLYRDILSDFCDILEEDNPNFDRVKFNKACGE